MGDNMGKGNDTLEFWIAYFVIYTIITQVFYYPLKAYLTSGWDPATTSTLIMGLQEEIVNYWALMSLLNPLLEMLKFHEISVNMYGVACLENSTLPAPIKALLSFKQDQLLANSRFLENSNFSQVHFTLKWILEFEIAYLQIVCVSIKTNPFIFYDILHLLLEMIEISNQPFYTVSSIKRFLECVFKIHELLGLPLGWHDYTDIFEFSPPSLKIKE